MRLAWQDRATGVHTTSSLDDPGDGTTSVLIHQRHVPEAMRAPDARAGFATSLERFAAHLKTLMQGERS